MVGDVYRGRLDALEQTWQIWGELGRDLTEQQWSTPTRCPGWDVACVYAHASMFPLAMSAPPSVPDEPVRKPLTAVEVLRRFNAPGAVASTMAKANADTAVREAAEHTRAELVDRFTVHSSRALHGLCNTEATMVGPWPASGGVMTLVEALRIVLLEATVPVQALRETAHLLAELAPAVELIEAATGRSTRSPLPVLY
jgi:Mycothiol maleylpyruvate isomerase N-terminal domain